MDYYIKADKFFFPEHTEQGGYLEIKDGKFGKWAKVAPSLAEVKDFSGQGIAPGLVDTHIHGYGGADVMDNDLEKTLGTMSEGLLTAGVTSWLPTPLTADHDLLRDICQSLGDHYEEACGAKIRGIFFEGPYFTEKHKGAQNPNYMTDPDISEFESWYQASKGLLTKIALAPEREDVLPFVHALSDKGIHVTLGHSNATYEQGRKAVEAGATIWCHTFNGMSGFTHREPGLVGAAMKMKNTYGELICDGYHVHPAAAELLIQAKGVDHVVLVTDSMRAAGMPDGEYMLGEFNTIVKDGAARLKEGGNLAGSILRLKDAIKNVVDWGIATPAEAIKMASLNPAKSVSIDDRCGQIKMGHAADFIVLEPDMELAATYIDGEEKYNVSAEAEEMV